MPQLIKCLEDYKKMMISLSNMERIIKIKREKMQMIKTSSFDDICIKGNGNSKEEMLDELISYIDVLEKQIKITKDEINLIDDGLLNNLSELELKIIDGFFFHPAETYRKTVQNLCDKLGYSESHLIRMKKKALEHCEIIMFGKVER